MPNPVRLLNLFIASQLVTVRVFYRRIARATLNRPCGLVRDVGVLTFAVTGLIVYPIS